MYGLCIISHGGCLADEFHARDWLVYICSYEVQLLLNEAELKPYLQCFLTTQSNTNWETLQNISIPIALLLASA